MSSVSHLQTIQIPRQQLIQQGKPLLTMAMRFEPQRSSGATLTVYHAMRMPNGTYKVYWVEKSQDNASK